jgi:carbon-monoxide dehydrogenase medium subunit
VLESECKINTEVVKAANTSSQFDYFKVKSVAQACRVLHRFKGQAALLAGGTDLIVKMRLGKISPKALVDIKHIPELHSMRVTRTQIVLGPLTTIAEIVNDSELKRILPILSHTALLMASPQVRNRGTVGGNLCNASPSADMAPPLLVLGTKLRYRNGEDQKTINLADFFKGPGTTILGNEGLLTAIVIPIPHRETRIGYQTLTLREAMDLSVVSAAAFLRKEHGIIEEARLALGAVAPVPLRAVGAEKILIGKQGKSKHIQIAAETAALECVPISDVRASEEYRREMIKVVTRRVLKEVLE